jgi:hypothetical protein
MRRLTLPLLFLGLAATGCGGSSNTPPTQEDLRLSALSDVSEMYRLYTLEQKKPPTKLVDFNKMEMMSPIGLRAIRTGEVIVRYGAALPDTGEEPGKGPGDEVLAYEKEVPETGGQVLMLNRTIRKMTSDEFKAAKLAGTSSSSPAEAKAKGKGK